MLFTCCMPYIGRFVSVFEEKGVKDEQDDCSTNQDVKGRCCFGGKFEEGLVAGEEEIAGHGKNIGNIGMLIAKVDKWVHLSYNKS